MCLRYVLISDGWPASTHDLDLRWPAGANGQASCRRLKIKSFPCYSLAKTSAESRWQPFCICAPKSLPQFPQFVERTWGASGWMQRQHLDVQSNTWQISEWWTQKAAGSAGFSVVSDEGGEELPWSEVLQSEGAFSGWKKHGGDRKICEEVME